jgi:hypothetical protein
MTKFELPSFQTGANSQKFKDNWDATFGNKKDKQCQFSPDCQREVDDEVGDNPKWCNFHLVTEGDCFPAGEE